MVLAYIRDDRILVRHKYWIDNRISGEGREIVFPDFFIWKQWLQLHADAQYALFAIFRSM